jgi:hypothetical protein
VYPAAFRRVIGVTGVTSEGKTYSGNSLGRLFRRLSLVGDWGFRGSYGPDGWLAGLNPRVNVDEVEAEAGVLRPYPIAASRDEFNGAESFWRLLFRIPANVPEYDRAQLDQQDVPNNVGRQQALAQIYYNMLLLQKKNGTEALFQLMGLRKML